ncbi:class I SAM-dependent methyltransferase [Nakamurella lactea]|uniref:class I SAM-dependent methyltransferase n=1 Tax=Nakamurella lactea TaxID=459515 RepID=UPI0013785AB9|nr:methyltransferase domain-containing protein [Nakamurella lactea]
MEPASRLEQRFNDLTDYLVSARWATADAIYDSTLLTRTLTCPVCGHSGGRDRYRTHESECQFGGGRLQRYECPDCDFVFGPMKMLDLGASQLAAEYGVLYDRYSESDSTAEERRAFESCSPEAGGLYLNWGCGIWASTISSLRAEGWDVWGYEPIARSESPFVAGSRGELSARFDAIFSNNLIEHLQDPVADFAAMREHLKPGGLMTHATACYDLAIENTRFHLSFFLGRSVQELANRSGFEIVDRVRDGAYLAVTFRARV